MSLDLLKAFDINAADVTVWVVKKSGGAGGAAPTFTARWIETDALLDAALKTTVTGARQGIEELKDYDLLAQNNEGSALSIGADETHAPFVAARCGDATAEKRTRSSKDLTNSDFYVIKLVAGDNALLAFRKTDTSWRSKAAGGFYSAVYADNLLTLDVRPRFSLSSLIDFFMVGEELLILNKAAFESILSYRQAHVEDFAALQQEPEFTAVFTSVNPLALFVGSNKIQLRRVSAIKSKGYYKDAPFMERLRAQAAALQLNIAFDQTGRIDPTPETCRDIIRALLDHRLDSRLSNNIYDVDDAAVV